MAANTTQDIVAYVIDRLVTGIYPPGSRLPASRELANELGVHRNTVAKAYRTLVELGLISSTPGRGSFAAARIDLATPGAYDSRVSERLAAEIARARRGNIREVDLRTMIDQHIATIYHAQPARGAFVECNTADLRVAITEITQQTDVQLAPVLLEDLAADPAGVAATYDVVFTSLFHLLEVRDLLHDVTPRYPIIGIHTQPDERALTEIAQIAPETRVGIVVSNSDGARRFGSQLQTFSRASAVILVQPSDEAIRDLATKVDLIVTSRSRAAQIRRLELTVPLIELSFHISRESANRVVDALHSAREASTLHDGVIDDARKPSVPTTTSPGQVSD